MANPLDSLNPTTRFSNRADNYVKYRPGYPQEVVNFLRDAAGIQTGCTIADIGSGTGIFGELLLKNGFQVFGIEPNKEMREKAEIYLSAFDHFTSISGTAESTSLHGNSVDAITIAQAFHWMDVVACKKEFERILKPGGLVVLLWNMRTSNSDFMKAYENLTTQFSANDQGTRINEENISFLFFPKGVTQKNIHHNMLLNYESLKGRLLSSSYIPLSGPQHDEMMSALKEIVDTYKNKEGFVTVEYETKIYLNK